MRHIYSIYDVKAKLSQLLRLVKEGETVVISDRGTPQFEIVLYRKSDNFSDRITEFVRRGVIQPATESMLQPIATIEGAVERFIQSRDDDENEGKVK